MGQKNTEINEKIFKAYDVRGVYPDEINEETVYLTAKAYAQWLKPKKVALGRDVRTSGKSLFGEAKRGLLEMGVDVVDIGVVSSEMFLFAVAHYEFDGGISITASHNPAEYNGMKLVREGSIPISIEAGLAEIRDIVLCHSEQREESRDPSAGASRMTKRGKFEKIEIMDDYLAKILSLVDVDKIKPMKAVVNPSNGAGGKVVGAVAEKIGLEMVKQNFEEDGTFPKGAPNPLLPENQSQTEELVRSSGANLGIAWDGDADRVFFFDENGEFIDPYYVITLLSQIVLKNNPGEKIVLDLRQVWASVDKIKEAGGTPIINKAGYVFIKERMRKEDAIFGGETSAHYFFRDFYFCDTGMIPPLMILQEMSETGMKLSEMVKDFKEKYPISGEINFRVENVAEKLTEIEAKYDDGEVSHLDGLSVDYDKWRFNIRISNTEPLIRLNIEARTKELVDEKVKELTKIIEG